MINRNVCLAFVFAASGVFSLPATAADANPWIGKWTLNVSNSRFNPGPAPKSEVIVTTDSGGGRFHSDVTIVGADGNSQHTESTYAYDGENYPVRGGPVGETVSL